MELGLEGLLPQMDKRDKFSLNMGAYFYSEVVWD